MRAVIFHDLISFNIHITNEDFRNARKKVLECDLYSAITKQPIGKKLYFRHISSGILGTEDAIGVYGNTEGEPNYQLIAGGKVYRQLKREGNILAHYGRNWIGIKKTDDSKDETIWVHPLQRSFLSS